MAGLYRLQTALINTSAQRQSLIGGQFLEDFEKNREVFRADWEKIILFLQQCYGYADDYISLCESAVADPTSPQNWVFLQDVVTTAKKVLVEAKAVKDRHERIFMELRSYRPKLLSALQHDTSASGAPQSGKLFRCVHVTRDLLLPNAS
jgi:hypothetical protein